MGLGRGSIVEAGATRRRLTGRDVRRGRVAFGLVLLTASLLVVGGRRIAVEGRGSATSVGAQGLAVPATRERVSAEGHLVPYPGAEVAVGSDMAGILARLPVRENQAVKKGDLIAELRAEDLRASLEEATAQVAEVEASIRLYEHEAAWTDELLVAGVASRQAHERSLRDRDAARARRATAVATVHRIESLLAKTRIVAPLSGTITARRAEEGEAVERGQVLVTIANLDRVRVEAEVDEFDAAHLVLGAKAVVRAEGYDGLSWPGAVEEIPSTVVNRRLMPQDPGRPTDTRILLVKVALPGKTPLKLRQRVQVEIDAAPVVRNPGDDGSNPH